MKKILVISFLLILASLIGTTSVQETPKKVSQVASVQIVTITDSDLERLATTEESKLEAEVNKRWPDLAERVQRWAEANRPEYGPIFGVKIRFGEVGNVYSLNPNGERTPITLRKQLLAKINCKECKDGYKYIILQTGMQVFETSQAQFHTLSDVIDYVPKGMYNIYYEMQKGDSLAKVMQYKVAVAFAKKHGIPLRWRKGQLVAIVRPGDNIHINDAKGPVRYMPVGGNWSYLIDE
ncbi:MAG TPA: hypothetical protein VEA59_01135 [Patescibacteria group bacterium]|nr:hypothetical protein [Patescibacteria group bacterium]